MGSSPGVESENCEKSSVHQKPLTPTLSPEYKGEGVRANPSSSAFAALRALHGFAVGFCTHETRDFDFPAPPNYGFAPVCSVDFSPLTTT